MNKEQMQEAIASASDVAALDALWSAWEKIGYSGAGLLYSDILARKQALGANLGESDLERLEAAAAKRAQGASLPPIGAGFGDGGGGQ